MDDDESNKQAAQKLAPPAWGAFRELLGSPLGANAHGQHALSAPPLPQSVPDHSKSDSIDNAAPPSEKPKGGWFSGILSVGGSSESEQLRKQVKEYEARLAEMRGLAQRQAEDISSLRTLAEQQVAEASKAGSARDEERWRKMIQEASSTQEQALAQGQRQLHELAASLQAAQRQAAEQQAVEWRRAMADSAAAHATVVQELQAQVLPALNRALMPRTRSSSDRHPPERCAHRSSSKPAQKKSSPFRACCATRDAPQPLQRQRR